VTASPALNRVPIDGPTRRALGVPSGPTRGLWRGDAQDPAWVRPSLLGLLAATALLYLWDLGASGHANGFYAAAVQAGTQSWKAMFFGSLDVHNVITVDKPAMSLWPMEISGRIFGFNSWSMLAPQALEGVASVALLYAAVRRVSAPIHGLLGGLALAVTPAAALMFRYDNPDALLVLLLTGASYAAVRALQAGSGRWLALAGLLVGLGFITKMGQALLVVPALGSAYLVAAPVGLWRRIAHLLGGLGAMVAGAGWYVAAVDLWPAGSRPYIGGSTDNTLLQLALGYNGLGRLFGNGGSGGGPGGPGGRPGGPGGFGGGTGLGRLFSGEMGLEISWLLPAALLALVAGFVLTGRAPRTDLRRAALIVFGGTLTVTVAVFSYMQGIIHPYYTIALAPGIGAVLAITGSLLWEQRESFRARMIAAVLVVATVAWDVHLLGGRQPWLRVVLVIASAVAVLGLLCRVSLRRLTATAVVAAVLTGAGASGAYAVSTAVHPHTGPIPAAGPVVSRMGALGPNGPGGEDAADAALTALLAKTTTRWAAATEGANSAAPLQLAVGRPVIAIGGFMGGDPAPTLAQFKAWVAAGQIGYYVSGGGRGGRGDRFPGDTGGEAARGAGVGGPRGGRGGPAGEIATWVAATYTAQNVGGTTVYDLRG
jgi:4-amino-4-deoxy-L-arabinose transferase-like glycosyltransferase